MCINENNQKPNQERKLDLEDLKKYQPEVGEPLTGFGINSSSTVQPNLLLRTPVFTPTTRTKAKGSRVVDLGEAKELMIGDMEGYEKVRIVGLKLSVETDFKVWCGIVRAIQDSGYTGDGHIELSFVEFAKLCGYQTKRIDAKLRDRIFDSTRRIMTQVVEFSKNGSLSVHMVHLVNEASFDVSKDLVQIKPCSSVWGLYKMDYTAILKQKVFSALSKSELASCLFMYIQSMPKEPKRRSMTRLRERMRLSGEERSQNRSIMTGLEKLKEIGYLKYHMVKGRDDTYLYIDARDQDLTLKDVKNQLEVDEESNDES